MAKISRPPKIWLDKCKSKTRAKKGVREKCRLKWKRLTETQRTNELVKLAKRARRPGTEKGARVKREKVEKPPVDLVMPMTKAQTKGVMAKILEIIDKKDPMGGSISVSFGTKY